MKDVLLINDTTTYEDNPGCHITMNELTRLLKSVYPESLINRLPFGYEYSSFERSLSGVDNTIINRIKNVITRRRYYRAIQINWNIWNECVESCFDFNKLLCDVVKNDNYIYVNGEGSIHHNYLGSVAIIGLSKALINKKLNISLVNTTIQDIDQRFVKEVLQHYNYIAAREPYTYRYLLSLGLKNVIQAADCAFMAKFDLGMECENGTVIDTCLYTPGVLPVQYPDNIRSYINKIKNDIKVLLSEGLDVTLLQVDKREKQIFHELSGYCKQIVLGNYNPLDIFEVIKKYKYVISGRYHILIFAAIANKQIIGLPTNTWKIKGLFELLDTPDSCIANNTKELSRLMKKDIKPVNKEVISECRNLAKKNVWEN